MQSNENTNKERFLDLIREALVSLYDPLVMRKSPLTRVFGLDEQRDVVSALRRTLHGAIESLQPNAHTPRDSKVWRTYHILRRRYIEQVTQREVALDLGLSIRQLQRDEALAREALADYLWDSLQLHTTIEQLVPELPDQITPIDESDEEIPSREQEIEYLKNSALEHPIDVDALIQDALKTIQPLLDASEAEVEYAGSESNPEIFVQSTILRQALINLLSMAIHSASSRRSRVRLAVQVSPDHLTLNIQAQVEEDGAVSPALHLDSLEITQRLIDVCGGNIEIGSDAEQGYTFEATVVLPIEMPITVLMIDDNADTRQLFQRYLSGTRYHFIGVGDYQQGLHLAFHKRPTVIVLDVMMPIMDGWTVLGQLRAHPDTASIPVIVCTILAQGELAYALGAAEFIRKPVSRDALLTALDRQLDLLARGSY
jgi:CheY-like chemotaxis protein